MKLTIEKAIYGGRGLARADGKAVFVPMALPGELVEVRGGRDKGSFLEAELAAVLEPSPERVSAPCPFYGACGGCQYQHAIYPAQLAMKRDILLETLARAGVSALPELTVHAGEPWRYRNRIRLHVDPRSHALAYREQGGHGLVAVDQCPIAAPLLEQALEALRPIVAAQQAGAWCAELELFVNHDESSLLLLCRAREGATPSSQQLALLCTALGERIPQPTGAGVLRAAPAVAGRRGRRSRSPRVEEPEEESSINVLGSLGAVPAPGALVARWGTPSLLYKVSDQAYQVSLGSFFQGNRFLVPSLLQLAAGGGGGELAWDLYAGVGLFAQSLVKRYTRVVAVEGSPVSSADLRVNAGTARVVESSTLAFLARAAGARERPDAIVLDPPRAGLGLEAATLLASVCSQSITYVSCDPATLARDLRLLVDAGYTIARLHLVDMFPQTFHLETVAELRLR